MKEKELERLTPLKKFEKELYNKGFDKICGIDEAGRGPLAGPVVVAGVIMPQDSIIEEAISYSVAIIGQDVIDDINILNATKKGVEEVVKGLDVKPDLIIVDALTHINTQGIPYDSIIKGDAKCYNIAAASILAKVTRDRIMRQWDEIYPQYGFSSHKGYGTAKHIQAIKEYGPCPIHRKTFIKHFV